MKKILALLALSFVIVSAFAQKEYRYYQDVVYLKDGSIIRGIIIEQIPNKSLKIETVGKNVFVYQLEDVEKITKEPVSRKGSLQGSNSDPEKGYKFMVDAGMEFKTGTYGMDRVKLSVISAYQANPYFSVGIGTGARYYIDWETVLIPVFADFRANLMNANFSPYVSLGVGYSFNASNSFTGTGLMASPSIGVSFKIYEKSFMHVGLGYELQKMDFYTYTYYDNYTLNKNSGAISLNFGISF